MEKRVPALLKHPFGFLTTFYGRAGLLFSFPRLCFHYSQFCLFRCHTATELHKNDKINEIIRDHASHFRVGFAFNFLEGQL